MTPRDHSTPYFQGGLGISAGVSDVFGRDLPEAIKNTGMFAPHTSVLIISPSVCWGQDPILQWPIAALVNLTEAVRRVL